MASRSKLSTTLVVRVAAVVALGVNACAPLFAEETAQTISKKVEKQLNSAQEALKTNRWQDAIAKASEADATSGKTPYDQHVINDFLAYAYIKTQSYPEAAKRLEAEFGDAFTPESEVPPKVRELVNINYRLKDYDKAVQYGRRAIKGGYGGETVEDLVGQAYYLKRDWDGTRAFVDELVTADLKQGKRPRKMLLELFYSACVRLRRNECTERAIQLLDLYYQGTWRLDLKAPQRPVGEVLVYFFGPPPDLGQERILSSAIADSTK